MRRHELLERLKRIRHDATMERSCFRLGEEPRPFGLDVTELVRISTRLWRHSWIIGPLDEIIEELEKEVKP